MLHLGACPGSRVGAAPREEGKMEALRTQLDAFQWELNGLKAENRRLKEETPEASKVVALEDELERTRSEVAELTERVSEREREVVSERARAETASGAPSEEDSRELNEMHERLQSATALLEEGRRKFWIVDRLVRSSWPTNWRSEMRPCSISRPSGRERRKPRNTIAQ